MMEPEANDDEGITAEISKIARLFSSGDDHDAALRSLTVILDNEAAKEGIRRCRGTVALGILDHFETILPKLNSSALRKQFLRLSSRLAEASRQMPSNSILQNITWESHPTGVGGYGEVRKGTYCNKTVAIKSFRIQMDQRPKWPALDGKICREALTWKHLNHPTLLPFLGVCCIDPEYGFKSMVSPWCERGNISNYFRDGNHLPNVEKSLNQLASGIRYMHSENVVHGDLTGNNVLLTDQGDLQICDFGLVKWNETSLITGGSRALGTYRYMAPELFDSDGSESDSARPSFASDVYAFACLALEMYTGRVPFFGCKDIVVPGRVMAGQRPARPDSPVIPDHLWDLIEVCWSQEPTARPLMETVVTSMVPSCSSGHGDVL
ncbi:kinase-like domain-containing protein [Mycena capillaripes]|nr:kinase-like domain-containing protein [Mycena capillaripes]